MSNLKSITELPMAESAEGLNLIVNDNGAAKQIAASAVGEQADWAEMNENSPAFIKNKPVEELDLDIEIIGTFIEADDDMNYEHTVNYINTFENIKNKILSGTQPKCKVKISSTGWGNTDSSLKYTESFNSVFATYYPEFESNLASIYFNVWGSRTSPRFVLLSDGTIVEVRDDF